MTSNVLSYKQGVASGSRRWHDHRTLVAHTFEPIVHNDC